MTTGSDPLDRDEIRRRLGTVCRSPEEYEPILPPWRPAAVLIGLVNDLGGPNIILTLRTQDLEHHPGQISFPGGKIELQDARPEDAALREAFEEIGLPPEKVELLGCMPPYNTVSSFRVYPFVGWIEPPVVYDPDEREVAAVFEIPLRFVLDPENHHFDSLVVGSVNHTFYVIEYGSYRVWGATAGMLVELARALGGP